MFKRLSILVKLQLSNKRKKEVITRRQNIIQMASSVLFFIIITSALYGMFFFMNSFLQIKLSKEMVTTIIFVTQIVSVITVINGLMKDLYGSSDNKILMSLPVKNNEIYFSKLIVNYITEFIRNFYFIIPFLLVTAILLKVPFLFYLGIVFMSILLPLIAVLLAAFLTIPLAFLKNLLKDKTILSFMGLLVVFGGVFLGVYIVAKTIPNPFYILSQVQKLTENIQELMVTISNVAGLYQVIGWLLFAKDFLAGLSMFGIIIGAIAVLLFVNYCVSRPVYFKLASQGGEHSGRSVKIKENKESRNTFISFVKKEFKVSFRSINEVLNDYILLIFMPFVMFLLFDVFRSMPVNIFGMKIAMAVNMLIVLLFALTSNTASATSITKEGYEFVLLKTAPSNTQTIAWAKIAFNLVFSTTLIFLAFLTFQILLPKTGLLPAANFGHLWTLFGIVILVNAGHILWSFQLDIVNPKLSEYAATSSLEGNSNASKSVVLGILLALLFAGLSICLAFLYPETLWIVLYCFAILFVAVRLFLFNQYLRAYFVEIEY